VANAARQDGKRAVERPINPSLRERKTAIILDLGGILKQQTRMSNFINDKILIR
jgi:hypothetical protein